MKKYTLENEFILVEFLDLGGCITKLEKKNNQTNFVLHYSDSETYQSNPYFLGATIGRNAGRTFPPYYLNSDEKQIRLIQTKEICIFMVVKKVFNLSNGPLKK